MWWSLVNTIKCWLLLILLFTLTMGSYWFLWSEVRSPLPNMMGKHRFEHVPMLEFSNQDEEQQQQQLVGGKLWTPAGQSNVIATDGIGPVLLIPPESAAGNDPSHLDFDEQLIILYNRVPKTGSTTFVNIAYDLCKRNRFHVLHINVTANMHVLSLPNQIGFVRNVSRWQQMKPALYHGHMAFLDFSKFQVETKPIYINLIRRPLDRLVSYYYFLRYGDNYRPNLVRKKAGNKITFDECVQLKQPDCDARNMWLQIPFFCGHAAECWEPGSSWALQEAKRNLANEYFLVGVTEQMEDFIDVLELSLPRIFQGFREYYQHSNKSRLRQTTSKLEPNADTIKTIMDSTIWQMENELYEFAVKQFEFNKRKLTIPDNKHLQRFMYEKIRPK